MRQYICCLERNCLVPAALAALLILPALTGCATTEGTVGLTAAGATAFFGGSPNNELEQIYYLGVFDEREQLPPVFYRVRVRGQASGLSGVKFASGWVQANLVDSLGTGIAFDENGAPKITGTGGSALSASPADRKLVLFGPEGMRKVPKDHRLVIVMGASPEAYFSAMDQALGQVSQAAADQRTLELDKELFQAIVKLASEQENLATLQNDVTLELGGAR